MKNPAFDAYIAKAADFAKPILSKIRDCYHKACPQIEEVMKWSHPSFECKGMVGSMAAFKEHAVFGFWKASLMSDPAGILEKMGDTSMSRGKLRSVADLPPDDVLISYIQEAVALNEQGAKVTPKKKRSPQKPISAPPWFLAALKKNKKALATFEAFSPSHRREYLEWVTEAKQDETRKKRLATAIEWMAEGKPRNWKYMKKK